MGGFRSSYGKNGNPGKKEMKHIRKTDAPEKYLNWCARQRELGVNYNYESLSNPEKEGLHEKLLEEQGKICGYTMKRISLNTSHIEHIMPRHICIQKAEGLDLDYNNFIACFPREGMLGKHRYGAQAKDKWWDNNGRDFLSPLNEFCELRVIFNLEGKISPTKHNSNSTIITIGVLRLDNPILTEDRKRAIKEFIYGEDGASPISPENVSEAIDKVYELNEEGIFYEFCIAIHDSLYEYLDILKSINENIV